MALLSYIVLTFPFMDRVWHHVVQPKQFVFNNVIVITHSLCFVANSVVSLFRGVHSGGADLETCPAK